ncbi:SDR family oxidoreductase [Streptomyces sp. MS19]|uniref:SDR family oxidoreductase n=1 Tax=Streptomyces sp. MS19 TaxID=3385972 RepID=UPI00399FEC57
MPAFAAYAASEATVRSFARTWAPELKDCGIRVDVVSPGTTGHRRARRRDGGRRGRERGAVRRGRPPRQGRAPEEAADAVAFRASARSGLVLGASLWADGGGSQVRRPPALTRR